VAPGALVENKRLGVALAMVKEHQATYTPNKRRYGPAGSITEQSGSAGSADKEPAAEGGSPPRPTDARLLHDAGCG
jgi:hypothetical protein